MGAFIDCPAAEALRCAFAGSAELIGYAAVCEDICTTVAICAGKLISETRPTEIPVESPSKFILTVDLNTATAMASRAP